MSSGFSQTPVVFCSKPVMRKPCSHGFSGCGIQAPAGPPLMISSHNDCGCAGPPGFAPPGIDPGICAYALGVIAMTTPATASARSQPVSLPIPIQAAFSSGLELQVLIVASPDAFASLLPHLVSPAHCNLPKSRL